MDQSIQYWSESPILPILFVMVLDIILVRMSNIGHSALYLSERLLLVILVLTLILRGS